MLKKTLFAVPLLLFVLLSGCSLPGAGRVLNSTSGPVTTLCPQTGTVRAAIAPTLTLGTHANLIYYDGDPDDGAALLKRTDIVSKNTTQIARLSNANITEAQISSDGQWILFTLLIQFPHAHIELRLIRVDGQYQQTLYCLPLVGNSAYSNSVGNFVWSPDATSVVLTGLSGPSNLPALYLLDLVQGQAQMELASVVGPLEKGPAGNTFPQYTEIYLPVKWLNNDHLYVEGVKQLSSSLQPSRLTISLLDTGHGANQRPADLQTVLSAPFHTSGLGMCDFDSNSDNSQLFAANCTNQGGLFQGPSTITTQPTTGGQTRTIYRIANLAIDRITAVDSQTLLFLSASQPGNGYTGDSLWRIGSDGNGLKRLASGGNFTWCSALQVSCESTSRDGSFYALVSLDSSGGTNLFYASLNGGPLQFVTSLHSLYQAFVGWTNLA
jgi:hypothetical protein